MERLYKDSGFDWIGKIPETWEVDIAKHVFRQRRDKGNDECQLLAATQKYGMYPQHLLEGVVKVAADTDLSQFKTVHKNDYVISLRSFQGGFEMSDYEGVCSPAYQVFYATRQISSKYYKYLFKSDAFIQEINSLTVGIREGKNILYDDFALLPIPIPSTSDQQRIADYLDEKCGEIDSLIGLQEQMIEKLKAYKQSVITEAVTKGLNPNAKLVPSGIDWIGEIPEGWIVLRIKNLFILRTGTTPKEFEQGLDSESLVNWFTPSDVAEMNCELSSSERHLSKNVVEKEGIELNPAGSLVFVGIGASAGKIGYANVDGYSNQQITSLVPREEKFYSKFSYYYMIADRKRIRDNAFFTTLPIINNTYLSGVKTLLPPVEEQQAIISYLDEKCSEIDKLIAVKQQKIEKLRDYKKSVIYEAVTGKINIDS
jgi:type I restriction enzyme S subunit